MKFLSFEFFWKLYGIIGMEIIVIGNYMELLEWKLLLTLIKNIRP